MNNHKFHLAYSSDNQDIAQEIDNHLTRVGIELDHINISHQTSETSLQERFKTSPYFVFILVCATQIWAHLLDRSKSLEAEKAASDFPGREISLGPENPRKSRKSGFFLDPRPLTRSRSIIPPALWALGGLGAAMSNNPISSTPGEWFTPPLYPSPWTKTGGA